MQQMTSDRERQRAPEGYDDVSEFSQPQGPMDIPDIPDYIRVPQPTSPRLLPKRGKAVRPERVIGHVVESGGRDFEIPRKVVEKFLEGWSSHVPLHLLTDKAVEAASRGKQRKTYVVDDDTATLKTISDELNADGELDMDPAEFQQAYPRFLQCVSKFFPREWPRWALHHQRLGVTKGAFGKKFPLYLRYDIELRRRSTTSSFDPGTFQRGIWDDVNEDYRFEQMEAMKHSKSYTAAPAQTAPNGNSASTTGTHSFRNQAPAAKFVQLSDRICIICGWRNHGYRQCRAPKAFNGAPLFVTDPKNPRDRAGVSICINHNTGSCRRASPPCTYSHICSICGAGSHAAQACSRAQPAGVTPSGSS
jgi:hypothetical protein